MKTLFNVLISTSGLIAIYFGQSENAQLFSIFKPLTTVLVICALLAYRSELSGQVFVVFLLALIACLTGDVFLLEDHRFVAGLSAFLIAHLLFVLLFVLLTGWSWNLRPISLLLLFGIPFFLYLEPNLGAFKIPVAIYSTVIILMAWQGISLSLKLESPPSYLLGGGALLFMFSDSMIAVNKFVAPFELSTFVILSTYWLSLILILNAVLRINRQSQNV